MVVGQAKDPKRIKAILEASIDRALLKAPPAGGFSRESWVRGTIGYPARS